MGKVLVVFILDKPLSALLMLESKLIAAAYIPPLPSFDTIEIIYLENLYYTVYQLASTVGSSDFGTLQ
jgi:hypothetical protein